MATKRSKKAIGGFGITAILAIAAVAFFVVIHSTMISVSAPSQVESSTPIAAVATPLVASSGPAVIIDGATISVDLSTTTAAIQKGLSGRISLGADSGMLFIFTRPAIYRFWMPDMNFPLDMIWIKDGKIVDISANVTTTFNPAAPVFYRPKAPAEDVLEVNAGFSAAHGIVPGDAVTFTNLE